MRNPTSTANRLARTLALLGLLALLAPAAMAQTTPCTPMVYAFRHAEDSNALTYPNTLTATGLRHADLYVSMLDGINASLGSNHCPVTKVYAINRTKADGSGNTTNPYLTAKPLARSKMALANPIETVGGYALLEYLGNKPDPTKNTAGIPFAASYTTASATALRETLLATARADQSSAIFWTSQGLHILGGAIINAESQVPQKNIDDGAPTPKYVVFKAGTPIGTPPRNAAYLFTYNTANSRFDDVTKLNQHAQCYNFTVKSADSDTAFRTDFWCGNVNYGDLGGNPKSPSLICKNQLPSVRARICNADNLSNKGNAYDGSCPSIEPKLVPPPC
jgi:hypothetical protein